MAIIAKNEIKEFIDRAMITKENLGNRKLRSFYKIIIKYCLSGLYTQRLAKELPGLIVDVAWNEWKLKPRNEDKSSVSQLRNSLKKVDCWGIKRLLNIFPSGIYKTPTYNLLLFHPLLGANFIVEFVSYSVESFVNSDFERKEGIVELDIELNDGNTVKQWGSWELWAAYRGLSVTNYLLESLLMSLEKYLLELAECQTEVSKKNLKYLFNYLLKSSNSVAITSVLSSIAIAYPEEVEEEILPLLSVKEFYDWDLNRSMQEISSLAPLDFEIPFAQEERWKSNQLPHRRKYMRGLRDFVIDYQFNIRTLNVQIHKVFDKLQSKVEADDVAWKKTLTEIDVRNHEIGEYDKKLGRLTIQPKYDDDVKDYISSGQEEREAQNTSLNYFGLISKAYEKKTDISFKSWKECYTQYSNAKSIDYLYDRPVTLAVLGLRQFKGELNSKQISWCIETITESIIAILQDTFSRNYSLHPKVNLMEKEIALKAFHLLFDNIEKAEDKKELTALMIYMLFAPFADHEISKITEYVRTKFFKSHPEYGKKVWIGLIKYAQFRKINPYFYDDFDTKKLKAVKENEEYFIQNICKNDKLTLNIEELDFEKYEGFILARAFIITPYYYNETIFTDFIKKSITLLIDDFKLEDDYSYNLNRTGRQIHPNTIIYIELYLAELLLYADVELSKAVIDLLLGPIYDSAYIKPETGQDFLEFSSETLGYVIYKLDEIVANSNNEVQNKQLIVNFWLVWNYLYETIKNSGKRYFTSILFLDIRWNTESSHWKVLENKKQFYHQMVTELGASNAKSIINVLSTVGEKCFLPDGLSWLTELLKKSPDERKYLITPSGERLIEKLFYNHISIIKNSKQLTNDFIWILDSMIDMGSSQAYLFRENAITYKKN